MSRPATWTMRSSTPSGRATWTWPRSRWPRPSCVSTGPVAGTTCVDGSALRRDGTGRAALADRPGCLPGDVGGQCGRGGAVRRPGRAWDATRVRLPTGPPRFESGRAMVRAILARRGAAAMLADATLAADLEGPASPWHDFALWVLSLARFASGDVRGGDEALAQATVAARTGRNEGLALRHPGAQCQPGRWTARSGKLAAELLHEAEALDVGRALRWLPIDGPGSRGGPAHAPPSW